MTDEEKNNNKKVMRVNAAVKWYHPEKGYGFLVHEETAEDIMIHFSTLDAVQCPYIKEGDRVICDIGPGKRGLHVVSVIEVKFGSPEPRSLESFSKSRSTPCDPTQLKEVKGSVKWYNPEKGYGFIIPDGSGQEIFIHSSIMREAGYKSLMPGVLVLVKVSTTQRGAEVHSLQVLPEEEKRSA